MILKQSYRAIICIDGWMTKQVVVRPFEAVARLAAPYLPQSSNRENTNRAQEQLQNALRFRLPSSFGKPSREFINAGESIPISNVVLSSATAGNSPSGGKSSVLNVAEPEALRSINDNSPTYSSPLVGRSSPSGVTSKRRGRGGKTLGAVKLELSPPEAQERRRRVSCSPLPGRAESASDASAVTSPYERRRASVSVSPPRRLSSDTREKFKANGAASSSKNEGSVNCTDRNECKDKTGVSEKVNTPRGSSAKPTSALPKNRGCSSCSPARPTVAVGSTINLRGLERSRGADLPRIYHCKDASIVVLGTQRIVGIRPTSSATTAERNLWDAGDSSMESFGGERKGVVTWVLWYKDLESCCVNVSAKKELNRSVGDVVVEITTR